MTNSPFGVKEIRVLLLDPLPLNSTNAFDNAHYQVDECFGTLSESEVLSRISDYNIVCLSGDRESEYLTDEVLRSAHRLLAIGVFGPVANQIDLQAAQEMGIPVFTAPFQYRHSIAEMIMAHIILISRQIGDRSREIHNGEWNKTSTNCVEVRGKTLGIVGYGHAGSQLGIMAEALSLRVLFYDDISLMPIGCAQPIDTLDELLAQSDYVVVNVTPSPENSNLFDKDILSKMKKGSYLVNVSAGDAVNHEDLAESIKSGHLSGAAMDVFPAQYVDGQMFKSPLQSMRNVILSPNIAGDTIESRRRIVTEITGNIVRYISEGTTIGSVNFPSVAAWPLNSGNRRIICMHRNVRGVLREIDQILSAYNVRKQVLDTKDSFGYLIADVMTEQLSTEIHKLRSIVGSDLAMTQTDKQVLQDMGFSETKVADALKATKNSGLQAAMDWLFAHADDASGASSAHETVVCEASGSATATEEGEITQDQATANSLKCEDCGKLLRDGAAAELHAVKTQHVNFSESTMVITPLTPEEKAQKLKDLQARLLAKREEKRLLDIEEAKSKEKIRRRTGQDAVLLKEKKEEADMKKAIDAKKREKEEEVIARQRVRAQLEADKLERHRKVVPRKKNASLRESPLTPVEKAPVAAAVSSASYSGTRIQIRTPNGQQFTQNFEADDKLSMVYDAMEKNLGQNTLKLWQTFPRKALDGADREKSLKDLGLVPSAALIAQ
ncbi:hypothetical protein BASA81_005034 [Batrachochytrium salamandrivorans]|nr:hypothetical protein BASA81_005034 [Batrachochytrium salamandrivorans]